MHSIFLHQIKLQPLAILVDSCIVINAYTLASLALFSRTAPFIYLYELLLFLAVAVAIHILINLKFGLYRAVGRYAGINQAIKISQASLVAIGLITIGSLAAKPSQAMQVVAFVSIGGGAVFILMAAIRFYPRIFYEKSLKEVSPKIRLLIVGAGSAGEMMIRSIQRERHLAMEAVAVVDDNPTLRGLEIHGIPIYGPSEKIPEICVRKEVNEILIAIPSASLDEFQRIWTLCSGTKIATKTVPSSQSIRLGKVGFSDIKDVEIEDVLGRQPVVTDYAQISSFFRGQRVLITGAGGSIGSELAVQISQHNPAHIALVDRDESALYQVHEKLTHKLFNNHEMCIADIKSKKRLEFIFKKFSPTFVFHAAAYKHVPITELHPGETILNNVQGTLNLAETAGKHHVRCFVNISTDKAVDPINIMGASKRLGEMAINQIGKGYPATTYCSVRFGNVLGSRGSVIPIFRDQIRNGGPVTVTHPEMTRYFMLVSEAVGLVLQAATLGERGVTYVLEMGKPVRIIDVATQMINMMNPSIPVDIIFTGLRPGEKMHERLAGRYEKQEKSSHHMIYRLKSVNIGFAWGSAELQALFREAEEENRAAIQARLKTMIPSYTPFQMTGAESIAGIETGDEEIKTAESLTYSWSKDESVA